MTFLDLAVLSLVVYRITRFIELDTMFEDTRDHLFYVLDEKRRNEDRKWLRLLYRKTHDGASCAFCVSVWVAAGTLAFWAAVTDYAPAWESIVHWLAIAAGGMVFYRYIDPD